MAISSPGIGSGLDVNSIVSQLMALERRPLTQLDRQEAEYKTELSAVGQIQSALASFQTAADALATASNAPAYRVAPGDSALLGASASSGAAAGSHAISVTQLASAQNLVAAGQTSVSSAIGAGAATTLRIDFGTSGGGSFTLNPDRAGFTVSIDSANNTLAGIRDAINTAQAGVTATIVNDGSNSPYRLMLAANASGIANSLKVTVSGDATLQSLLTYDPAGTQNLVQTQSAQNAQLTVDGIAVTRSDNTITDAMSGITLNLLKTGNTSLAVQKDSAPLKSALEGFVKTHNDLNRVLSGLTAYKAVLQGDSSTLAVQRQIRSALATSQGASNLYQTFSDIGLSFQGDGTLSINSTKLQQAMDGHFSDVATLASGFGTSLKTLTASLLGASGPLVSHTSSISQAISALGQRRSTMSARLDAVEGRYRAQFSALDRMLADMSKTSSFLQQQLANLPGTQQR